MAICSSKDKTALVLICFVVFFILALVFYGSQVMRFSNNNSEGIGINFSDFNQKKQEDGPIGVIEVSGVILDSKSIIERLHKGEEDEKLKALIVRVDSPGGAVGPVQEIYQEIQRIDQTVKPVYCSFATVAASGGYYIGAATRKIYSNPGTLTGSIGVIMNFVNLSKLYDFAKVSTSVIKAGRYKDIGSTNRDMTQEENALMNNMIKEVHKQFIDDIKKTREGKIKGDLSELAQGQIFSGSQALEYGLIDALGSLWQAGREIHKELGIQGKFGLKFIKDKKDFSFLEAISGIEDTASNIKQIFSQTNIGSTSPMYMYTN